MAVTFGSLGRFNSLTFAWWNLHNFAHFDPVRFVKERFPQKVEDYEAKRDRIADALAAMSGTSVPDIIAVCEITPEAADDLLSRLPEGYELSISEDYPWYDGFQVAVFFNSGKGISRRTRIHAAERDDLPRETRPMIPVHVAIKGHDIRFVACHWTAFDADSSHLARERLADVLRRDIHEFLTGEPVNPDTQRHVIVIGDFNEEPHSHIFSTRLIGRRDRESSRKKHLHWRDEEVRRIRLYNASWRFLGEKFPHGLPHSKAPGAAGTYFSVPHEWRTFDQVIVSEGLLGDEPPYFDESNTGIFTGPLLCDERGMPKPFEPGSRTGISDHLPIIGRLVLPEVEK